MSRDLLKTASITATLVLLACGAVAAYYAYDKGFTKKWRRLIISEFREQGLHADIGKLTLDPVEGLVARNIFLYDDEEKKQLLASINHITLDIDLGKMLRKEQFLSTIDFRRADLSLPLDPADPESERVEITDFSARILLPEDRIEITQADGNFYGMRFAIRGTLKNASAAVAGAPKPSKKSKKKSARQRLETIKKRRSALFEVVQLLKRVTFTGVHQPTLNIDLYGPVGDTEELRALFDLKTDGFEIASNHPGGEPFIGEELEAKFESSYGKLSFQKLFIREVRNEVPGEFHLRATYPYGGTEVDFALQSSIDVHSLAKCIVSDRNLHSFSLSNSPTLIMRGKYLLGREISLLAPPLDVLGKFGCEGFVTPGGEIFDGFEVDFRFLGEKANFRNAVLEHRTGTATGHFLVTPKDTRYDIRLRMDPLALLEFTKTKGTQDLLKAATFGEESTVVIDANGTRLSKKEGAWHHTADVDLRDFRFRGQLIDRLSFGFEELERKQTYRDFQLERPEGLLYGNLATYDWNTKQLSIEATSNLEPMAVARCIGDTFAAHFESYRFDLPPKVFLKGTIDCQSDDGIDHDFTAHLDTKSLSRYEVAGAPLAFDGVVGQLQFVKDRMRIDLSGELVAETDFHDLELVDPATTTFSGDFSLGESPGAPSTYEGSAITKGSASYLLGKAKLPLEKFQTRITGQGDTVTTNSSALFLGGAMTFTGTLKEPGGRKAYKVDIDVTGADLEKLMKLYEADDETGGKFAGTFSFTGTAGDPQSVRGRGKATLANGNVFAIPVLGPLSKLVSAVFRKPFAGHSVARSAGATFRMEGQKLTFDDFESKTKLFKLGAGGVIDFENDQLDITAKLDAQPGTGILFAPITQFLEYRAKGTISEPTWKRVKGKDRRKENQAERE